MGFADLDMATKTITKDQATAIQGDASTDRHLAIVRRIMQNNTAVGVVLIGLNYDSINRILAATPLGKGYMELRQGKLTITSVGKNSTMKWKATLSVSLTRVGNSITIITAAEA